ncbi:helix-turn-helix domain-containing protein [Nocardia takedensis]|uniref:helix-turn-helix domain-containing protein n=1 Tax=Nocardia takedensis TaxID=259390 RepID=UPI000593447F|nr:helix-turn-helix transcriptional regulator [Nocardia takedensis]
MTASVQQQREALGRRLRELRAAAGLSGAELARRAGWHQTKVPKLEYGRIKASDNDIRAYCRHTGSHGELADLLATRNNLESAYVEWRKRLGAGTRQRQQTLVELTDKASIIRIYNPMFVPGFLQTAEYAAAVLRNVSAFYQTPDDVEAGVAKRLERQQLMYRGSRKFHFLLGEQAMYTTVGSEGVMAGQLDRLLAVTGLPRVTLGIVPFKAGLPFAPTNFTMFDREMALVEGISAELTVTQPRELALYGRAFDTLAARSVTGEKARALIRSALESRSSD